MFSGNLSLENFDKLFQILFRRRGMFQNQIKKLYSKRILLYHRFFLDFLKYGRGMQKFWEDNLDYIRPKFKILDAGCGSGIVTKTIYALAGKHKLTKISFHGFDLTPTMLNLFKQWIHKQGLHTISLKQADVLLLKQQLPPKWKDYDLIVSSGMLEYIPKKKIEIALLNLKERLKGKGTLLLFITKNNLLNKILINLWWKANLYGKDEITKLLWRAGYKKITFKKFTSPYSYLNHWGFIIEAKR